MNPDLHDSVSIRQRSNEESARLEVADRVSDVGARGLLVAKRVMQGELARRNIEWHLVRVLFHQIVLEICNFLKSPRIETQK